MQNDMLDWFKKRVIAISQDLMTWVCVVAITLAALGLNSLLIFFLVVILIAPDKMHAWFKAFAQKVTTAV